MNKYLIVISTPNCPWIKKSEYIRKRILFYHIPILTISKSTSGHTWTHNNCIFQAFLVGREVCFNKWYNVHLLCTGSVLFYFLVFVLLTPQKNIATKFDWTENPLKFCVTASLQSCANLSGLFILQVCVVFLKMWRNSLKYQHFAFLPSPLTYANL